MLRSVPLALAAVLVIGLAPYGREPDVVTKLRWIGYGAQGMTVGDWGELVLHGAPWVWLAYALLARLPLFNRGRIADAQRALAAGGRVVDVRTPGEFQAGHLPGAVNAPLDALPGAVERLTKGERATPLLLYCRSGARSARAAGLLRGAGFRDVTDLGGLGSAQVVLTGVAAPE